MPIPPMPGSEPYDPSVMVPNSPNGEITSRMSRLRQIIAELGDMAKETPSAKQEFELAGKALTQASQKLLSMQMPNDGQPQPQQPVPGA